MRLHSRVDCKRKFFFLGQILLKYERKIIGPHFNLHKIKLFINSAKIVNFILENMFLKQNIYF